MLRCVLRRFGHTRHKCAAFCGIQVALGIHAKLKNHLRFVAIAVLSLCQNEKRKKKEKKTKKKKRYRQTRVQRLIGPLCDKKP